MRGTYLLHQFHDAAVPSEELVEDMRSTIAPGVMRSNVVHEDEATR